jgi:hypothetical protein
MIVVTDDAVHAARQAYVEKGDHRAELRGLHEAMRHAIEAALPHLEDAGQSLTEQATTVFSTTAAVQAGADASKVMGHHVPVSVVGGIINAAIPHLDVGDWPTTEPITAVLEANTRDDWAWALEQAARIYAGRGGTVLGRSDRVQFIELAEWLLMQVRTPPDDEPGPEPS